MKIPVTVEWRDDGTVRVLTPRMATASASLRSRPVVLVGAGLLLVTSVARLALSLVPVFRELTVSFDLGNALLLGVLCALFVGSAILLWRWLSRSLTVVEADAAGVTYGGQSRADGRVLVSQRRAWSDVSDVRVETSAGPTHVEFISLDGVTPFGFGLDHGEATRVAQVMLGLRAAAVSRLADGDGPNKGIERTASALD